MNKITEQQKQFFNEHGYLVVDDVLDAETVLAPLRNEYVAKLTSLSQQWESEGKLADGVSLRSFEQQIKATYAAGLDYFQPLDISLPPGDIQLDTPYHLGDAVFSMMTDDALLDTVEAFIGPELTSNPIQHVRIKPPSGQLYDDEIRAHITITDWHQDRAVTLEDADHSRMMTVWIAISDATELNGCLQVIPGSHNGTMQPHCPQGQLAIPTNLFDVSQARPVPVKAGGIILFHPLTIHSSLPNQTDGVRWSFDLRYNVTGDPTGRPMFPSFVARSRNQPETELRDPERWRQLWFETRERLTTAPAVEIHRWPADAAYCA